MMSRPSRRRTRTGRPCLPGCSLSLALAFALVLVPAGAAHAQSVTDPRTAEFDPSPDHATLLPSGAPMVTHYQLEVYRSAATSPFHVVNIGKPAPRADGKIAFGFWDQVPTWPLPGGTYEARVAAVGPDGVSRSSQSNPFTFTVASSCTYALSSATVPVSGAGDKAWVTVTAGPDCTWATASPVAWATLSPAAGSGTAAVAITVSPNPSASGRSTTVMIAGRGVALTQTGAPPPLLAQPTTSLVIGKANTVTGARLTAGSVVKLYVASSGGPRTFGPYTPTSWTATSLTFTIPADVAPGNGFAAVQVVNTDTGFQESNIVGALLGGNPALNLPTITQINGVALAPPDLAVGLAHVDTVLAKGATVTLTGTGFSNPVVNVFTSTGNLGPLEPLAGGTATQIQVTMPASAPTGPGNFQVVNRPGYQVSAAVSSVIGAVPTITGVTVSGGTITVNGTGFSPLSVINLYNTQGDTVVNLGGFGAGGPRVPLTVLRDTKLTFTRPAAAVAGPAFVEVLNPPFIRFSSSGADPDGAFTMPAAPPPAVFTALPPADGEATDQDTDEDADAAEAPAGRGGTSRAVVTWTRPVEARVEGDAVAMAAPESSSAAQAHAWRAGARSTQAIIEGDGALTWTVSDLAGDMAVGLGSRDADATPRDLDFAWRLDTATRELTVVERGVLQTAAGTYATGDRLRILVRDGRVEYRRNGSLVWTSREAPRYPLVADTSLGGPAARLAGVALSGRLGTVVDWPASPGVTAASMYVTLGRAADVRRAVTLAARLPALPHLFAPRSVTAALEGTAAVGFGAAACDYCVVRRGATVEVRHDGESRGQWGARAGVRYRVEVTDEGVVRYWAGEERLDEAPVGAGGATAVRGWLGRAAGSAIAGAAWEAVLSSEF